MKEKEENTNGKKFNGGTVNRGLRKSLHADQHFKKPDYHRPEQGHTAGIKKI